MPISVKEFYQKRIEDTSLIADKVIKMLKDNPDKAYSILDFQTEFAIGYSTLSSAMRSVRQKLDKELEVNWYKIEGRRMLFYHYNKKGKK